MLATLREQQGLDFSGSRRVLDALSRPASRSLTELVEATGVSRRWVSDVLTALGPWVRRAADRFQIAPADAALIAEILGPTPPPAGFQPPEPTEPELARALETMRAAHAGMPPAVWSLDHVPATPWTAIRRAHLLRSSYDLAGRHVLCVGDHDLTSVALGLLAPEVTVSVVDIDERLLSYLRSLATEHGLNLRTVFADLRAELPASLHRTADLVFTDPPYTPAGIELFLTRGIAALRRGPGERLLFCFSANERQLARSLEVQRLVTGLHLTLDALLPGFNEFTGAESIGSRSALWVCQPTARSFPTAERRAAQTHVYTRGRQAEEAPTATPTDVLGLLREHAAEASRIVTVGTGQDADVPVESLLRSEPPAGHGGSVPPGSTLLVDLSAIDASYATRLLLRASAAHRLVFAIGDRQLARTGLTAPEHPVRRLLAARYAIELPRHETPAGLTVLVARTLPAEQAAADSALARYVLDHPRARLLSAWREGLIAVGRQRGVQISKNEARAWIAAAIDVEPLRDRYLCELPQQELDSVARALCAAPDASADAGESTPSTAATTRSPAAYQPETS